MLKTLSAALLGSMLILLIIGCGGRTTGQTAAEYEGQSKLRVLTENDFSHRYSSTGGLQILEEGESFRFLSSEVSFSVAKFHTLDWEVNDAAARPIFTWKNWLKPIPISSELEVELYTMFWTHDGALVVLPTRIQLVAQPGQLADESAQYLANLDKGRHTLQLKMGSLPRPSDPNVFYWYEFRKEFYRAGISVRDVSEIWSLDRTVVEFDSLAEELKGAGNYDPMSSLSLFQKVHKEHYLYIIPVIIEKVDDVPIVMVQ